jgi:hypothetical protein
VAEFWTLDRSRFLIFMRCFQHHEKEAVGICKACCKGVCPECAIILPRGLACSKECEARILEITARYETGIAASAKIRDSRQGLVIIAILLGIGFLLFGFSCSSSSSRPGSVLVGGCFLAFGIYELYKFKRKG